MAWYTYLPCEDTTSKRKLIRRTQRKKLEDAIISYYQEKEDNPFFREVFARWMKERLQFNEIALNSYTRYLNDFERFFPEEEEFCKIKINRITESDIEKYIKRTITRLGLTQKTYAGLRILLRGTFKYAKREHMTTISISSFFCDLSLPPNIFVRKTVDPEKEVFNESETEALVFYLRHHITIENMGLLLMFQSGVRVGELAALTKEDVLEYGLKISKTEISYKDPETKERVVSIKQSPKGTSEKRVVILSDDAMWTLHQISKLNPDGEFLFMREGRRIRTKNFNYYLHKACRECKIPERSTHKIRKTYGSTLMDNNVDESLVVAQMGHADILTTKNFYYFNTKDYDMKKSQINHAVCF